MAADVAWEDVIYSIDKMLAERENQDDNPNLGYHEAALLLNRLEMALSVLCSLLDTDLDLDRNTRQVLSQLCSLLTEIYQYWDEKVIQMRRRTVQQRKHQPNVRYSNSRMLAPKLLLYHQETKYI